MHLGLELDRGTRRKKAETLTLDHEKRSLPFTPPLPRGKRTRGGVTLAMTESWRIERALGRTQPDQCPPCLALTQKMRRPKQALIAGQDLWSGWIVIYGFVTNYHKRSRLKQHTFVIVVSVS